MKERLVGLAGVAARRPATTLAIVVAAAIAGGLLSLGLSPSTGISTFVSSSSASYRATIDDQHHFGSDAVIVLIREPLTDLLETKDLARTTFLEACLGGQYVVPQQQGYFAPAPRGSQAAYGGPGSPCGKLMRYAPVQAVYGPGTFLNRAVAAVDTQVQALLASAREAVARARSAAYQLALARHFSRQKALIAANAAAQLEQQRQYQGLTQMYLRSGINGTPRIDDPQFIPQVVFDQSRGVNQPKARFAYLFPTATSALIQIRLKAGLTDAQRIQAIDWIRQAVAMPMFSSTYGGTYTVTGAPVLLEDLSHEITSSIGGLLVAALLVMAGVLLVVFRRRLRLLPLFLALCATGITFGLLSLLGGTLTMASMAVLPILIGLAVDYAVQVQSRAQEALTVGDRATVAAVLRAAGLGAPTIATAALATGTGFLVLLLSPVPMVQGFGLLLVVGIAVAFVCALAGVSATLILAERDGGTLGAAARGAGEIMVEIESRLMRRATGVGTRLRAGAALLRGAGRHPERVLAIGAALAVLGWVADTQTSVQSDVTKLVPANLPGLRDLRELEHVTGVSGEVDVIVHAPNVATAATVNWMKSYENSLFAHYGYLETRGCQYSMLCPALSLPDLFGTGSATASGSALTDARIHALLSAVPAYFSQAVITGDRKEATLAFGIRLMPLSRQAQVIDYMRSHLHPPPGVSAQLAGLPVLAAQADAALSSPVRRLLMLLAGLVAVGLVLLAVFRRPRRAIVPLVPIALATGWSALILFLIGIPLNPMSATLGTLVIAISTEFSVLLSERYLQERAAGLELGPALERTYRSTGAAVLASGLTAIAGFGVLVFSSITMLRDFGFVTLIDMTVSLAGVLLVLPAVLVLAEREGLVRSTRGLLGRLRLRTA